VLTSDGSVWAWSPSARVQFGSGVRAKSVRISETAIVCYAEGNGVCFVVKRFVTLICMKLVEIPVEFHRWNSTG
jgi:hypothetical protein